ncbi:MAG TPA: hypothetical protein VMA72_18630 [Streptosporangiaceae bacterium]|nr:hypothetical protein [Streptosporangiaceae bacterium]
MRAARGAAAGWLGSVFVAVSGPGGSLSKPVTRRVLSGAICAFGQVEQDKDVAERVGDHDCAADWDIERLGYRAAA